MRKLVLLALPIGALVIGITAIGAGAHRGGTLHQVTVPHSDRFTPFALDVHVGDSVKWVNTDADNHTVVADSAFDSAGHHRVNRLLGANGGNVTLRFNRPGTFVYYCRFHAHLNRFNQPVAPGPDGGVQDAHGNFGTPMSGVVTVLPN
jgi:plastocyanin